jgi:hypothetical protein
VGGCDKPSLPRALYPFVTLVLPSVLLATAISSQSGPSRDARHLYQGMALVMLQHHQGGSAGNMENRHLASVLVRSPSPPWPK